MSPLRDIENRFFRLIRDPGAASGEAEAEPGAWDIERLRRHKYCLLTSYRASGKAVATPVWFGVDGERIYIRSGAGDGKVKRIRRDPQVLIAPCTARGRPTGTPMRAAARILAERERDVAERALRRHYGLGRKVYRLVRRRLDAAYLEVGAG